MGLFRNGAKGPSQATRLVTPGKSGVKDANSSAPPVSFPESRISVRSEALTDFVRGYPNRNAKLPNIASNIS
jgi:hypothetical protein